MVLVVAVFAAVRHAETVSVRLGETIGVVLLALAVTSIEVGLIASVMFEAAEGAETVARDTVFAGVMLVLNGVIGFVLLAGARGTASRGSSSRAPPRRSECWARWPASR